MKNSFFSALFMRGSLVVLLLTLVMACSKSSSEDGPTPSGVVGDWKFAALLVKEGNATEQDLLPLLVLFSGTCFTDLVLTFKSDGTYTTNNPKSCKDVADEIAEEGVQTVGKWAVMGNKITLTDGSGGSKEEYDLVVNGATMEWSNTEKDAAGVETKTTIKFKK